MNFGSAPMLDGGQSHGFFEDDSLFDPRYCRECGCDDHHACVGADGVPCHWVEDDLCSACAEPRVQVYTEAQASAFLRTRGGTYAR